MAKIAIAAAPIAIPAIAPVERSPEFPPDTATGVCVGLTLAEEVVEVLGGEEVILVDVADVVVGSLVGTPSGGKYSPGTNA